MTRIAITGATGQLGRLAVEALLRTVPAGQIIAIARDPSKAEPLKAKGVEVRLADYDAPETLAPAMQGADTLVMISASDIGKRGPQHAAIIEAARVAGIKLVVYTSILHADTSGISLASDHRAAEAGLKAAGLRAIMLRNGWYLENYTGGLGNALASGFVNGAAGDGRISAATRADYADAIAAAATGRAEVGKAYELGGDTSFTMAELAAELSRQSGKPIGYNNMSEADYAALLASFGLPAGLAADIANWDTQIAKGALFTDSGDLSGLIGRPTTTLAEAVAAALAK